MQPTWFDWMVWATTLCAIIVPVWITTVLWRRDHRKSEYREQERALRDLVRQLEDLDGDNLTKVRFGYMSEFLEAFGGAVSLGALIDAQLDRYDPEQGSLDISIDVGMLVRAWRMNAEYRADSTEIFYARNSLNLAEEDSFPLSLNEVIRAEDFILLDRRIHPWLKGTRMSVSKIRGRKVIRRVRTLLGLAPLPTHPNIFATASESLESLMEESAGE